MRCLPLDLTLDGASARLSLLDAAGENGWDGLRFFLETPEGTRTLAAAEAADGDGAARLLTGPLGDDGCEVVLTCSPLPEDRGWEVVPVVRNRSDRPLRFTGYGFAPAEDAPGPRLAPVGGGLRVYAHSENLRYERLPHCRADFPFVRPLPTTPVVAGDQASGPLPALALGQAGADLWLVQGATSQARHLPAWDLGLGADPSTCPVFWRSRYTWSGGAVETVSPGEDVDLEGAAFLLVRSAPDGVFADYMDMLAARYAFQGRKSRLDRESVYCTWNFEVFTGIDEAACLRRMDVVKEAQGGGYFQIDHGYQPQLDGSPAPLAPAGEGDGDGVFARCPSTPEVDAYYPDASNAWDRGRFPNGPEGFVRACRERGLRPGIWWSPRVGMEGRIQRERPEWLLQDARGERIGAGHLMLDPSVPEVRAFLTSCLETIMTVWGFEGIKVDFWSYAFDHPDAAFRQGGTNVQWRNWFIRMVREKLGPEGYFLYCISCPLGNPFYALEGCDAFRAGVDIHSGEWSYHVKGGAWLLPAMLATGKTTWFGNIDSCMGSPDVPVTERRSRLAYAYMTAGMFEFSGPVETLDEEALDDYRRLAARADQGTGFACPEEEPFYGRPYPRVLVRHHAEASRTRREHAALATVGLFNWADTPDAVAVPLARLGLDPAGVRFVDFWSGAEVGVEEGLLLASLAGRDHLLVDALPKA